MVRLATIADLEAISRCHIAAFPNSLSSRLGKRYTRKMLQWYLTEGQFLILFEENSTCLGYAGGFIMDASRSFGSSSSTAQYTFSEAVLALLIRPWLIFPFFKKLKLSFLFRNILRKLKISLPNPQPAATPDFKTPSVGLVVIGVQPDQQGRGIGKKLLMAFEEHSRKLGYNNMHLSVEKDNKQAIAAYTKAGWEILKQEGESISMDKTIQSTTFSNNAKTNL